MWERWRAFLTCNDGTTDMQQFILKGFATLIAKMQEQNPDKNRKDTVSHYLQPWLSKQLMYDCGKFFHVVAQLLNKALFRFCKTCCAPNRYYNYRKTRWEHLIYGLESCCDIVTEGIRKHKYSIFFILPE